MNNMQIGGWYNNPAAGGKNQRYWGNGVWTDGADPNQGGNNSGNSADSYFKQSSGEVNKYIDDLLGQAGGQRDLALKKLDTEHKLALGNDDTAKAKFLEDVASSLEDRIGRIPYDYQKYSNRELQDYALGNTAISQNKQNALDKLTNDEKTLSQNQGQSNQNTVESLNERGLITGQAPTGGTNQTGTGGEQPLTGLTGLAGNQAGVQNANFGTQWSGEKIAGQGIQNAFGQQQSTLDFNHQNSMTDLTDTARRGAQNEQNNYDFGNQTAQLNYQEQMKALERARANMLSTAKTNSVTKAGISNGTLGY